MRANESDMEDTYRGVPRCPSCGASDYEEHDEDCENEQEG